MREPRKRSLEEGKRVIRIVKRRLSILIGSLGAVILVLAFKVGEALWPAWVIGSRPRIIGILLLAVVCLIVLSPFIIEYCRSPRALSGPGKNPYEGNRDL